MLDKLDYRFKIANRVGNDVLGKDCAVIPIGSLFRTNWHQIPKVHLSLSQGEKPHSGEGVTD